LGSCIMIPLEAWNVFSHSNTEIIHFDPTHLFDVSVVGR
jgi:hypothetical protein